MRECHVTRAQRIHLAKRLFEVAGDMSDMELAYALGMPAAQVRECRRAAAEGKPIPVKRTRVVEVFVEQRG